MRTSKLRFLGRKSALAFGLLTAPLPFISNSAEAQESIPKDSTQVHTRATIGGFSGLGFTGDEVRLTIGSYIDVGNNNFDVNNSGFTIMPYGTYNFSLGNQTETNTETTTRERELVGKGTYKTRTDEITTETDTRYSYEFGVEVSKGFNNLEAYMGIGLVRKTEEVDKYGTSTIEFERNGAVLDSGTIENKLPTTEEKSFDPSLFLGLRRRVFNHAYVGAFYTKRGKENIVGVGVRLLGLFPHK